jgi:MFS family permease
VSRDSGNVGEPQSLIAAPARPLEVSLAKIAGTSLIGTAIEWYDFFICGNAAALIFGTKFFPTLSALAGSLAAFSTFTVGFLARPVGGVVMGHFGDRIGRKSMLVTSLLIMGVATFLIGLLPTYAQIGVWAPILLAVLRFIQGLGVGGEWGGAVLIVVERAPKHRRGFYGGWPRRWRPHCSPPPAPRSLRRSTLLECASSATARWPLGQRPTVSVSM